MNAPTNISSFILEREAFDDDIVLILGNSSYIYSIKDIRMWFVRVGVHKLMFDKILDALWNFRRVKYTIPDQRLLTLF